MMTNPIKIVAFSDTHVMHDEVELPDGDILIHSGDSCAYGNKEELSLFVKYLNKQPHKHKIIIAGNHDRLFETDPKKAKIVLGDDIIYLQDSFITVEGIKIYGAPWQPRFGNWSFNIDRGIAIKKKWDLIPPDIDILVTHGPPHCILDNAYGNNFGCEELRKVVDTIKPKYHIFGHIHEGYGISEHEYTTFINASICDDSYRPNNKPVVFDY